ncbi:hypothetical protein GCM10010306_033710 [Streptomyces umbrinus]|nr:hypothetical protein GCM10010306_033710 [Streptomyces umbrinus]GHH35200.1 hypothetical protein GCM10018775_09070 [Streptomyces umbrinus]
MPDRALPEEHDHVEVDAVDALDRLVRVPGPAGLHRADLHADSADAQVDGKGKGPDPVAALTVTAIAATASTITAATTLGASVRHVPLASARSRSRCPTFTKG